MESVAELSSILKQPHSSSSTALSVCVRDSLVHSDCSAVTKKKKNLLTNQTFLRQPERLTEIRAERNTKTYTNKTLQRKHEMRLIKNIRWHVWKIFALMHIEFAKHRYTGTSTSESRWSWIIYNNKKKCILCCKSKVFWICSMKLHSILNLNQGEAYNKK